MRKFVEFYKQIKIEAMKVVWVGSHEVWTSTLVILLSVTVFSILCLALDYSVHNAIQFLLKLGK